MKRWSKADLITICNSSFEKLYQKSRTIVSIGTKFGHKILAFVTYVIFETSLVAIFDKILQSRLTPKGKKVKNDQMAEDKDLPYIQSQLFEIMLLLLSINFLLGIVILLWANMFIHFFIHLVCLTIIMYITMWIASKFLVSISYMKDLLSEEIGEGTALINSLYMKVYRKTNLIPCAIVVSFFFWGIFSQGYIQADLVGIYAVLLVTIVVSISVVGYMGYIWLLWFLYRLNHSNILKDWSSEAIPAKAPILVLLAELTNKAKVCFFVEGFIYVFQYFILIPDLSTYNISIIKNPSFVLTWAALFIVIVLGFPAIVVFQEHCITSCVNSVKQVKLERLNMQYKIICEDIMKAYYFEAMMGNILKSDSYPIKMRKFSVNIISFATFILHTSTLLSQLLNMGEVLELFNLI